MKKSLVSTVAIIAASALGALGVAAPASAAASLIAPILTADTASSGNNYYGTAAVSNDGSLAASVVEYGGVTIYNVADGTQRDISVDTLGSEDLGNGAFSPDNRFFYVADYENTAIIVVDLSDDSVDRTISLGFSPWAVNVSPDGTILYVHSYSTGDIAKVVLATDTVTTPITENGSYAWSMCMTPDGATLYSPNYVNNTLDLIDTATMSTTTTWNTGVQPYGCELDNDGNVIVTNYGDATVQKFAPDGTSIVSESLTTRYLYGAAPSCDTIYGADADNAATIPVLDLSDLAIGTALLPAETSGGDGFLGYNADRSLDGSVVAIGGYYSTDGLALIVTPECDTTPTPTPELANTGVDAAVAGISTAVAGGMLIAGAIALVAIRRRNA